MTDLICERNASRATSRRRPHLAALLASALALAASGSAAQVSAAQVSITSARVLLRDVMPDCPEVACGADLGPAPPPGASRLIPRAAISSALASAGERGVRVARAVRVTSAARTLSPAELAELVRPSITQALPAGVQLSSVEPKSGAVLPLLATAGACTLPPLPRRAGPAVTTALVDFSNDGVLARRIPVLVRVVLSAEAARPSVPRGHVVTLVIERRTATVSTQGIALGDAEIGELAQFKVQRTGRIVSARVEPGGIARVVQSP